MKLYPTYSHIKFHLNSGNAQYVTEKLDQGLFDLGIVAEPAGISKYDYLRLPEPTCYYFQPGDGKK
ncbi:MAG: hypothetical protein HFG70_10795 [Hungatella sp.]|jgi:hypothetical protein|nr:hypothetical protein [Hungatella sp.]